MNTILMALIPFTTQNYENEFKEPMQIVREETVFESLKKSIQASERKEKTTRFYIVRHGQSEGKIKNLVAGGDGSDPLSKRGIEDAHALGRKFLEKENKNKFKFSAIFSSPTNNAKETAEIIATELNAEKREKKLTVIEDSRLRQKHWGTYHGRPICESYKQMKLAGEKETEQLPNFWEKFNFKFEKSETEEESLRQAFDRLADFFAEKSASSDLRGKDVLVITHSPLQKAIFSALLALNHKFDLEYHWYDFDNRSMVIVDLSEDGKLSLAGVEGLSFRGTPKYQK